MDNIDTHVDEAFDTIKELNEKDTEIMQPVLEKLMTMLGEELSAKNEFGVKHGYMAVGKLLIYLSQSLCKDEEMFKEELDKSQELAINRIVQSILPKIEDGKIVEQGYDLENLSIRRIMISLGTAVDYTLWRTELANYQEVRKRLEKEDIESADSINKEDNAVVAAAVDKKQSEE